MDYEKAYKAVLQTATQWIKDGCTYKEKICLECVFPELRESERIRKKIIDIVKAAPFDEEKDVLLDWLEKQKINTEGDFGRGYDCGYQAGYAVAMNEMKPKVATVTIDSEKQKEQKHVEVQTPTDEEIEKARKQLHKFKVFVVKMADKHQVCFSYDHDFEWDNFCGEILYYLNGNQKPVEWSEEDERRYLSCLHRLGTGNPSQPETVNSKWFKEHVHSRPSWKPSEEQMRALYEAAQDAAIDREGGNALYELYENLKRL